VQDPPQRQGPGAAPQVENLAGARQFLIETLNNSAAYNPSVPDGGRASVRNLLVAVIQFLSELFPNDAYRLMPLNHLLYGLADLDNGRTVPLLKPVKVKNRPKGPLNDALFRAMAAAAMTRLMDPGIMSRQTAAEEIARMLTRMGYKHPSGKLIRGSQLADWREKMETDLPRENIAVARYRLTLDLVKAKPGKEAAEFILQTLPAFWLPNFPKKPHS